MRSGGREIVNNMEKFTPREQQQKEVGGLDAFDFDYFKTLEGENGWLAIGMENCKNQQYYTVNSVQGEKLGVVGVYDTDEEKNIAHTVVDPKFRGQGLAEKFKDKLMDRLSLPYLTLTIDLDNTSSIKSAENMKAVKISDEKYEQEFHKVKYRVECTKEEKK